MRNSSVWRALYFYLSFCQAQAPSNSSKLVVAVEEVKSQRRRRSSSLQLPTLLLAIACGVVLYSNRFCSAFFPPSPLSSVFSKKSPGGLLFRLCLLFFVWKWKFGAQFKLILSGNFLTYNDHWKGLWDEHFWFEITWIIWGEKSSKN